MAAKTATAAPGWLNGGVGPPEVSASQSLENFFRLADLTGQLSFHLQASTLRDNKEFAKCCIALAKCIDFSIQNDEVPVKPPELPSLLKQVCQCKCRNNTAAMRAAIMVLMVSVKNACQLGWFTQEESRELLALADEIGNCFRSLGDVSPGVTSPGSPFLQIMDRFYPFFRLGHIVASVEAKPGFVMLVTDFHISKETPRSPHEKMALFVVQKDNIETSACITNPPQVSFLLNGMGVDKRINVSMDMGPQLPTIVDTMLKYGTNLLQAMGYFNGHYIIVLAFTHVMSPTKIPLLKDYVQSGIVESSSDSDVIEGPSRISLNCPISRFRIKLPVKGHLCKHLQCFDFWNFVNINMRRPSWRCPHCNQPVSYPDIRVDQNMVKVLEEVGCNATDVIISTDGSWKVVMENDENIEPVQETNHDQEDSARLLNTGPSFLDLTGGDDGMNTFGNAGVEDQKPLLSDLQQPQSAATNSTRASNHANNAAPTEDFSSTFQFPNGQNPFSAPSNTVPQLAQTTSLAIGQAHINISHILRTQDPLAVQSAPVQSIQASSPQDRPKGAATAFSQSIPSVQSSQFQDSSVMSLVNCMGRTASLLDRWHRIGRASLNPSQAPAFSSSQNLPPIQSQQHPSGRQSPGQLRSPLPLPSSLLQSQTPAGVSVRRQTRFINGAQFLSRASNSVDLTPDTNYHSQGRMRGSLVPGSYSTDLDHMIIRPTQHSQATRQPASRPVRTLLAQSSGPYVPVHLGLPFGSTGPL